MKLSHLFAYLWFKNKKPIIVDEQNKSLSLICILTSLPFRWDKRIRYEKVMCSQLTSEGTISMCMIHFYKHFVFIVCPFLLINNF